MSLCLRVQVVQLPTAFEGGVITVKHKGVTKSLDYSGISAHRASYTGKALSDSR
jgi:hypothetical protein